MKEPNLENLENPEEKDKKETIELNENVKLNSKDEKSLFEKFCGLTELGIPWEERADERL